MSGHRTSPSFDVVATTRRSWTREQKHAIVAEIDVGGATLSQVARRHGMHASLLFRWRKTLGSAMAAAGIEAEAALTPTRAATAQRFVPVMLPAPPATPASTTAPARSSNIEIVLAGGRTLRVGGDVDTAALLRIVAALEQSR